MISEYREMASFQHVTKVFHGLVYRQQFAIVRAVTLLCGINFLEKKARSCQSLATRCCRTAPRADVEASVTSANGAEGSGCANRVACDRLDLHALNASLSSGVQLMGCEPSTLGPERRLMKWCLYSGSVGQKPSVKI
jgi:hypothetical protein